MENQIGGYHFAFVDGAIFCASGAGDSVWFYEAGKEYEYFGYEEGMIIYDYYRQRFGEVIDGEVVWDNE